MTIAHIVRQERTGGLWMIRHEGRVVELSEAGYEFMAQKCAIAGGPGTTESSARPGIEGRKAASALATELARQALLEPATWATVRHVPSDVPRRQLPPDAAAAPKRIYFEITRACNLACRTCFNNSRLPLPSELSFDEIIDVNRQAAELGVFEIRYTGGECTIVPRFSEIVADARQRGIFVSVGTNGVYTDEQLEWLPWCGIDRFLVSLDGDRAANDCIRGAGTFDHVVHTLHRLTAARARVRLNMVVGRHNVHTLEAVAEVADASGVGELNIIPLRPYGRSAGDMALEMFDARAFHEFIAEVNQLRTRFPGIVFSTTIDLLDPTPTTSHDTIVRKTRTCAAGVEACVVGPQGHVYGCSYSPASFPDSADEEGKRIFIAGQLQRDSLRDIWRDSGRWTVFRDIEQFKHPKCHDCRHYAVRCSGSCQIMAWHQLQRAGARGSDPRAIADFCDPYCFAEALDPTGDSVDPS